MLHGLCFGEEAGARNLAFFRVKWLQPTMKGTSSVRRVRLRSFSCANCSSYVFCNEWLCCAVFSESRSCIMRFLSCAWCRFADRIGMAASRLLGAAAACVILLSFAAEDRKSYWSGCIQAAKVNCLQIFSILALIIFLLKFLLKSASKPSFFLNA